MIQNFVISLCRNLVSQKRIKNPKANFFGKIKICTMRTILHQLPSTFPAIAFFLLLNASSAQASGDKPSVFNTLTQAEGVKMTLDLDLTYLMENRKDVEYHTAALTLDESGKSYPVEVRVRGKFRRKNSEVPPLKIKFKKKILAEEGLDTLNEMKLVLPAVDNSEGDELLLREYAAYRMYEKLSPYAIRARLVRLTLRDTHNPKTKMTMYALLLEDIEELCARVNAKEVETFGIPTSSLEMESAAMVTIFEYMIGNTDWDISMMRNVKLIQVAGQEKVITVPYDFDFSGLVGAPYATPSSDSGLRTVRDRFLMSSGIDPVAMEKAIVKMKSQKDDLFASCMIKTLNKASISEMMAYLNTFYKAVENANSVPVMMKVE